MVEKRNMETEGDRPLTAPIDPTDTATLWELFKRQVEIGERRHNDGGGRRHWIYQEAVARDAVMAVALAVCPPGYHVVSRYPPRDDDSESALLFEAPGGAAQTPR